MRKKKSVKTKKRKKKNIPAKKKSRLRRIARIHSFLTALLLIFYLAVGFSIDPLCLKYDLSDKLAHAETAAINLTLHIAGPPEKPVVAATPGCAAGSAYVQLNWAATNDTIDYDILRDGVLLVTGIVDTAYRDTNVGTQISYTYQVIANGTLGTSTSDDASATTGDCFIPIPPPACSIVTIEKIDLTNYSGIPKITDRTPTITGTTNIPNAVMRFEIYTGPSILATSNANANGYWSLTVPEKLNYGLHTIYVTAIDPADNSRFSTSQLIFEIEQNEEQKSSSEKNRKNTARSPAASGPSLSVPRPGTLEAAAPFALKLEVGNKDKLVYTGTDLIAILSIVKLRNFSESDNLIKYEIIDSSGRVVLEKESSLRLKEDKKFPENIGIPEYLKAGTYIVRAETQNGIFLISAENKFEIRERPILNLGGGMIITYSTLVSSLGYIFIWAFLILLIFLFLAAREYWLSRYATLEIDEGELAKDGFIS